MPPWATVVLTLGATGLGIWGTLRATALTSKYAREEADRKAAAARKERAAGIIGRLRTLLADAHPDKVLFNFERERTSGDVLRMKERFEPLRDELSIFAAADHDTRVSDFASKLQSEVSNLLNDLAWIVAYKVRNKDTAAEREAALLRHKRTLTLARAVLDLVHGRQTSDDVKELAALDEPGSDDEKELAAPAEPTKAD